MESRGILFGAIAGVLLLIVAATFFFHRPSGPPSNLEVPAEAKGTASTAPVPSNLVVKVYVDGSGSIEHFLHNPQKQQENDLPAASGTNYLYNLLTHIETKWGTHKTEFWRFGGKCPSQLDKSDLDKSSVAHMATQPAGSFTEPNTLLDIPYEDDPTAQCPGHAHSEKAGDDVDAASAPPELRILISDLYVSDPQHPKVLNEVGKRIADKYLGSDSTAVGILTIRNPYFGHVEDLPDQGNAKPVATSMPFYVILAGPAPAVQYGVRVLLDEVGMLSAFEDQKARLFYFGKDQNSYDGLVPHVPEYEKDPHRVHLLEENYNGTNIPFYRLDKGSTLSAQWSETAGVNWASAKKWDSAWSTTAGAVSSDKIRVFLYPPAGRGKKAADDSKTAVSDSAADDSAGEDQAVSCSSPKSLLTCVKISRSGLLNGRDYRFRVDVLKSQSPDFDAKAPMMRNWNIELEDAAAVSQNPGGRFPRIDKIDDRSPGLTPAFADFLTVLQLGIFSDSTQKQVANHHYIFVHAN
jgi:hypothetical protein